MQVHACMQQTWTLLFRVVLVEFIFSPRSDRFFYFEKLEQTDSFSDVFLWKSVMCSLLRWSLWNDWERRNSFARCQRRFGETIVSLERVIFSFDQKLTGCLSPCNQGLNPTASDCDDTVLSWVAKHTQVDKFTSSDVINYLGQPWCVWWCRGFSDSLLNIWNWQAKQVFAQVCTCG